MVRPNRSNRNEKADNNPSDNESNNNNYYVLIGTIVIGVGALIMIVFSLISGINEGKALEEEHQSVINKHGVLDEEYLSLFNEIEGKKTDAMEESFGVSSEIIMEDSNQVEDFLDSAFTWVNGDEYDTSRDEYIDMLGKKNSFTKHYMPENIKIETYDSDEDEYGETSFIDENSLKSKMDSVTTIPIKADGDTIHYTSIVVFHMYKESIDNIDKSRLDESYAIVDYKVYGDASKDERKLSEVKAWNGFSTSLD